MIVLVFVVVVVNVDVDVDVDVEVNVISNGVVFRFVDAKVIVNVDGIEFCKKL